MKRKTDEDLHIDIQAWLTDFEMNQPGNLMIDTEDTFEGSAYALLQRALKEINQ